MSKKRLALVLSVLLPVIVAAALALNLNAGTLRSGSTTEYVVKAGDSCRKIASEHQVPAETLIALNHRAADCSNLSIGQKIILPVP